MRFEYICAIIIIYLQGIRLHGGKDVKGYEGVYSKS